VNWEEFWSHLKYVATEQVENTAVEEKAEARLRNVFKSIGSTKTILRIRKSLQPNCALKRRGSKCCSWKLGSIRLAGYLG